MRLQVNEIRLEGADRSVSFSPGLNIITGPIASGKTTLVRYLRFLLGGSLGGGGTSLRSKHELMLSRYRVRSTSQTGRS